MNSLIFVTTLMTKRKKNKSKFPISFIFKNVTFYFLNRFTFTTKCFSGFLLFHFLLRFHLVYLCSIYSQIFVHDISFDFVYSYFCLDRISQCDFRFFVVQVNFLLAIFCCCGCYGIAIRISTNLKVLKIKFSSMKNDYWQRANGIIEILNFSSFFSHFL